MSGRKLAASLVGIALLTFVLPPVIAMQVNALRIDRARVELQRIVDDLRNDGTTLADAHKKFGVGTIVLAGQGAMPKFAKDAGWPEAKTGVMPAEVPQDPWGNAYLVVLTDDKANTVLAISAGPNGTVETAFASPLVVRGDDVGMQKDRSK